jgi:isoleucyl-tRNA synthetase
MAIVFDAVVRWLAPVLCFTAEEAWLARHPGDDDSVHLQLFPEVPPAWSDAALAAKWEQIRDIRRVVTGCLELARADKRIGSSLQAAPIIHLEAAAASADLLSPGEWDEVLITSAHRFSVDAAPADAFRLPDVAAVAATFAPAPGEKCQRCWKVLPEVGRSHRHALICERCADAVDRTAGAA